MTKLEAALASVPAVPLESLTLAHVTVARWASSIVNARMLVPQKCHILCGEVLYFSYGAAHYRPKTQWTEDAMEFPVAFVFDIDVVSNISRFYPFDTGAVVGGLCGAEWSNVGDLEQHYVAYAPERLVSCFYGSNQNYLRGKVTDEVANVDPLPALHEFLSTDLSAKGIDGRQRTIECVAHESVSLLNKLRWVGYPDTVSREIHELWMRSDSKFKSYRYVPNVRENPSELAKILAEDARKEFEYLHEPPLP
jgi:hypothetical protein